MEQRQMGRKTTLMVYSGAGRDGYTQAQLTNTGKKLKLPVLSLRSSIVLKM